MSRKPTTRFQRACALMLAALVPLQGLLLPTTAAAVDLANQPVFASNAVPGNLALALSVEWPTASRMAHTGSYSNTSRFLGYFDPEKCYEYRRNATGNGVTTDLSKGDSSYFAPIGVANSRVCSGAWSGNFLNWATTTAIDPFRWAMTGGRRVVDSETETILEKGWHSGQGLFDDRNLPVGMIAGATPFSGATSLGISINGRGFAMRLNVAGATNTGRTFNAKYYNNKNLNGQVSATVTADTAYHDWGSGSPAGVSNDNFSAEYVGTFIAPETGNYRFRTNSDDGIRVWLNKSNQQVFDDSNRIINNWTDHGPVNDDSANVAMNAGDFFSIRIHYYESGGGATMQFLWQKPSATSFTGFSSDSGTQDYTVRVKVCDSSSAAGGVESNCKPYGSNYKPEGLIQKYAQDIRFSAFGYLNESGNGRDGGVMRARQAFVGPTVPVPGQPAIANTNPEWNASTGVFPRNPRPADASSTSQAGVTIADSGVINYLNKFGQLYPGNYKDNDPVGELYYATLRYFRNLGNVPAWSNMNTADTATVTKRLDGFPVITAWDDPIQYSCQRNFVLGIGDIYTHGDKNVPGNTNNADEPSMPAEVTADTTVNAVIATNKVGKLQDMGNDLGTRTNVGEGCCSNNSARMAGLAYDANTKDIRPDDSSVDKTLGKQTVQTYWVDVLERAFYPNNQYYLAAKFGGMKVPSDFDPYTFTGTIPDPWWFTNGETVGEGDRVRNRPDNYFTAGRPDTMVSGLTRAFENIVGDIKAFTTSFSLAAKQITAVSNASYATQYDSSDWSGELTGSTITIDSTGTPLLDATPTWTTASRFETQLGLAKTDTGWSTNRRVVTWNPEASNNNGAGIPFRIDSISNAQKALLNTTYVDNDDSANYLNWLRGDASLETAGYRGRSVTLSTGVKRRRLGDIVSSKVTVVAAPPASYSETVNPGYRAFKKTYENRQTMLYVGANDGMLHAFKGGLDANAGTELFAYIPSVLFHRNPTDTTAPTTDGLLAQLGRPSYQHRNYVDATAKVHDVNFNHTAGNFTTKVNLNGTTTADWRSVLIGGLGKGGRTYYAIDVTDPSAMTSESAVAGKVLWEFPARNKLPTAAGGECTANCIDMGYSYGEPIVVKTAKYGWVVLFTSGYNNVDGKGHLFVVNPKTGALLEDISTGDTPSSGMARPTAYVRDYTDMTADSLYVGDLNGQLWRFDLSVARGSSTAYAAPVRIALLTDSSTRAQPVTSRPLVEIHPVTRKRFVLVGTGRLLHSSDIQDGQSQTFYGIMDGGIAAFSAQANDGVAWPVARSQLMELTDPAVGVNTQGKAGWRLELGKTGTVGWRVVGDQADAYNGTIGIASFPSLLPKGDACSPSGASRAYAFNYATGKTVLTNSAAYISVNSVITDLNFLTIRGKTQLVAGDNKGAIQSVPGNFGDADPRRLSWREIPVGN